MRSRLEEGYQIISLLPIHDVPVVRVFEFPSVFDVTFHPQRSLPVLLVSRGSPPRFHKIRSQTREQPRGAITPCKILSTACYLQILCDVATRKSSQCDHESFCFDSGRHLHASSQCVIPKFGNDATTMAARASEEQHKRSVCYRLSVFVQLHPGTGE